MRRAPIAALLVLALAPGTAAAAPLTPDQLKAAVREISTSVEAIRQLRFKTPVTMEIIDGRAARAQFAADIDPAAAVQARHMQNAYVQLRLVPPGTDLVGNYLASAEKDVLGYYDWRTKKLHLLSHTPAHEVRGVIAHELTHALEDQHYDFQTVTGKASSDDHSTAIRAISEGSAMVMQVLFQQRDTQNVDVESQQKKEQARSAKVAAAPSFVQQTVMLPYLLGISFLLRGKPWAFHDGVMLADIDAAYRNPPRSTREILHPEQYWWGQERKRPAPPELPDLSSVLGPGWSKAVEGSVGELGLAVLTGSKLNVASFEALLPNRWTQAAATGTTGDVYHHYVNGDLKLTVLRTQWESQRDADEFAKALVSRGNYFLTYGINVLVVSGDVGDKGPALGSAALSRASFYVR